MIKVKKEYLILSILILPFVLGGLFIHFKQRAIFSDYVMVRDNYVKNPTLQTESELIKLIAAQHKETEEYPIPYLLSEPYIDDESKENLMLLSLKNRHYKLSEIILNIMPRWIPNSVGDDKLVDAIPMYKRAGEILQRFDSSDMPKNIYRIKVVYAINAMPLSEFYNKYAADILDLHYYQFGTYIQTVLSYLGCNQDEKVWVSITGDVTASSMSRSNLPVNKEFNEAIYFQQVAAIKKGVVPELTESCKMRMDNEKSTVLEFNNGALYSSPNPFTNIKI